MGTKISEEAVISAGSVVNKNVEPYTMIGGTPQNNSMKMTGVIILCRYNSRRRLPGKILKVINNKPI